jgi:hypothetical protein
MTKAFLILTLFTYGSFAACRGDAPPATSQQNKTEATGGRGTNTSGAATTNAPSVTSSHGGPMGGGGGAPASGAGDERAQLNTAELDAKIAKAEAKAKASGASDADKKAAADAYFERGMIYFNAGNPRLYRYALGDLRRAVRYDPNNAQARQNVQTIEDIYRSMGRPVPDNGNEP